ncbi:MAG: protein phosphatase CheZ [Methyloligellaceae bacterium]
MQAARKRVFRIEQARPPFVNGDQAPSENGHDTSAEEVRHREVMAAIQELKDRFAPEEQLSTKIIEDYKHDLMEANKLKDELHRIYEAINKTKQEIATIQQTGLKGVAMSRVTDELSAIVEGTEQATETILASAEQIDQQAGDLVAMLKQQQNADVVGDIQDQVISIFEACNFQDLTGQRITKVVNAFRFIEDRVGNMMEIWGGLDSFKDVEPEALPEPEGDEALLHGPPLEDEEGLANQDDIDAMFD